MSGSHCARFPTCMESSERPIAPKCNKLGCPGARTWADVFPELKAVAETDANAPDDARLVSGASSDPVIQPHESGER